MDENRKKALDAALGQIERQFGKGTVMRLGDSSATRDIDVISTGSLALDVALGIGGLPKGQGHGNLWTGVVGQDDPDAAGGC